jgi:hypothetical protein
MNFFIAEIEDSPRYHFTMVSAGQFQLAPIFVVENPIHIISQSHTSNSIFSILIDSMYEVSQEDIMIHKQKGFIVAFQKNMKTAFVGSLLTNFVPKNITSFNQYRWQNLQI